MNCTIKSHKFCNQNLRLCTAESLLEHAKYMHVHAVFWTTLDIVLAWLRCQWRFIHFSESPIVVPFLPLCGIFCWHWDWKMMLWYTGTICKIKLGMRKPQFVSVSENNNTNRKGKAFLNQVFWKEEVAFLRVYNLDKCCKLCWSYKYVDFEPNFDKLIFVYICMFASGVIECNFTSTYTLNYQYIW